MAIRTRTHGALPLSISKLEASGRKSFKFDLPFKSSPWETGRVKLRSKSVNGILIKLCKFT